MYRWAGAAFCWAACRAREHGRVVVLGAGEGGRRGGGGGRRAGCRSLRCLRVSRDSLARMCQFGRNVTALHSYHGAIAAAVQQADLLIGSGAHSRRARPAACDTHDGPQHASRLGDRGHFVRPGTACIETIRPTDYKSPTYVEEESSTSA